MDPRTRTAFIRTMRTVASLLALPPGWNSYQAQEVDPQTAIYSLKILVPLLDSLTAYPTVVPTVRGGVQFEWHTAKGCAELCVAEPGNVEVYVESAEGTLEWTGDPEAAACGVDALRLMVERVAA